MCFPRICLWAALCVATSSAQTELSPEVLLLARVKVHMEENLTRLPNYTCLQTIERSRRRAPARGFELADTLRLEVALVDKKELFAWPGAGRFEDREIRDIVETGAIGNGAFGLHAYSVFLSRAPTFTYVGERIRDGRRTIRYDYHVPQMRSGYLIRVPPHEAVVGYHGSFWVDAETLDLIRLEVHAEDIPPHLGVAEASDSIDYARVKIGDQDFLLPHASELIMVDFAGNESRNRTQFSDCRLFTGESFLSFGEPPVFESPAPGKPIVEIALPAGLPLELKLKDEIDSAKAFVGDPVTAVVHKDVRKNGAVVVPKGTLVSGRITRLEKIAKPRLLTVGLQFLTVELEDKQAPFTAVLQYASPLLTARGPRSTYQPPTPGPLVDADNEGRKPGLFVFRVDGHRVRLPRGFRMMWRTEDVPFREKQ